MYKHLENEPWPEIDDTTANRQLIRHAACKTVTGQKKLNKELRRELDKFMENREKEKAVRAQSPVVVTGLEPGEKLMPEGATKAKKGPKKQSTSAENTPKAVRQSGRARTATDIPGGVAIDVLHASGKRKRAESASIFDTIDESWDNDDIQIDQFETAQKQDLEAAEKDSQCNTVIKAVKETARLEETTGAVQDQPKSTNNQTGGKEQISEEAKPENEGIASMFVKLFEEEDLAVAGTEAKMRGRKHPEVLSRKDS